MNNPIDPQITQFYLEMGFTQMQIRRAHESYLRTGADILDTLNHMKQIQPQPPPSKQQNNYLQQLPLINHQKATVSTTFLTPMSKIRVADYEILFSKSNKHLNSSSKVQLRQTDHPVGLLNVSNCCYLNSLLQCYFLMNSFKIAILTFQPLANIETTLCNQSKTKVKRIKSEYELLAKLKWFFTKMSITSKRYLDPTTVLHNLVDSVGEKVSYGQEKDLSEINILIIQRLSEGLTYSKNHYQIQHPNLISFQNNSEQKPINKRQYNSIFNPKEGSIKKLFYGSKAQYYVDTGLQGQLPIVSDFTGLILNPRSGNLYKALDDELNFEVEINGGIHKKVAYIRDEPEYLFLYINRAEYDKEEGQTLKNRHKFNFDFAIYLDRYLEKYREQHSVANQKIRDMLASKQKLLIQRNNLHLLCKKVEECHKYAQQLEGWSQRLPNEEDFDEEFANLQQKLDQIQQQLNKIQSRKEQYHLMYIFVHRGDAVSGHYWGYGRNDALWYKFDINTKKIAEDQIIIDLQKSAATPYALLYVKQQNLPRFDYKIWNQHVLIKERSFQPLDFRYYLQHKLSLQTITENQQFYNDFQLRTKKAVKDRTSGDYIGRCNIIKKLAKKYNQERLKNQYLIHVELINNFSLFLEGKAQYQLCKFTLFQQALLAASNNKITVQALINDSIFLQKIQKKFKNNCKGEYYLKSYTLLPKQVDKYIRLAQQFQLSSFQTIWSVVILNEADNFVQVWNKCKISQKYMPIFIQQNLRNRILRLLKLIRIREALVRSEPYRQALQFLGQPLWISLINREITAMIILQIEVIGVKLASLQSYINLTDPIGNQLALINAGNSVEIDQTSLNTSSKETAIDLVNKFNQNQANKANQSSSINSKTSSQKRTKHQGDASPNKSNAMIKQSIVREKKHQQRLTVTYKSIFVLQNKQCWKLQELQKCQLNYDFNSKLVQFLKKIGIIRQVYQKILKRRKAYNIKQLQEQGLLLNRLPKPEPPNQPQESLI